MHHRSSVLTHFTPLTGERRRAVLHLLRPGVHDRGAGLWAPDVRAVHAGAVLPQQAQPDNAYTAIAGLPLLPRQHLAAARGQGKHHVH